MSNQEQLRAKSALYSLQSIFLCIQRASSEKASANAEADPSRSEAASESAAPISDFDAYLNSLHSTVAAEASATATVKSDVTAFAEALVDVQRLGRLKLYVLPLKARTS